MLPLLEGAKSPHFQSMALLGALLYVQAGKDCPHLQDEEEEEIGVGHFLELLEEVDRQEGDNVVLGGLDAVALGTDGARRGSTGCQGPITPPR